MNGSSGTPSGLSSLLENILGVEGEFAKLGADHCTEVCILTGSMNLI
jgi:hypothetical protein